MTLQPGPLSPAMVSLLTAGRSVLRDVRGLLWVVRDQGSGLFDAYPLSMADAPPDRDGAILWDQSHHGWSYIGERSDDGWITAPPGGWGSNPVPGRNVFVTYSGRSSQQCASEHALWPHAEAFRLVEEAGTGGESGSNRKGDLPTEPVADRWAGLEGLAKAATPGEWTFRPEDGRVRGDMHVVVWETPEDADAAFIAAANPSTVLELIAAARAKEAGECVAPAENTKETT